MKYIKILIHLNKLYFSRLLYLLFFRYLSKKNIWLICEKYSEARDNGYWLFNYINHNQNYNDNIYYVIMKKSYDIEKIAKTGNYIIYGSLKHYIYYWACTYLISSQTLPYPCERKLCVNLFRHNYQKKIKVWLQHGVTKDKLSHSNMDYEIFEYDLISCAAKKESEFIQTEYHYPEKIALPIGFCRFDYLNNNKIRLEKIILIMPTYRTWLSKNPEKSPSSSEIKFFLESDFYYQYSQLLHKLEEQPFLQKGYKVIFYLHYGLQKFNSLFKLNNPNIIIANRQEYDVQELLIKSQILVTDYSSVFFDFAYMKKNMVFFQFDLVKYRENHYNEGYFSYEKDGYGPVVTNYSEVISFINSHIDRQFMDVFYQKRLNDFFAYVDSKNCARTYNAIKKIIK